MARNAIKCDFRPSKMAAGGHFVKKKSNKIKVARNAIKGEFRSSIMKGTFNYHIHASKNKTVAIWLECLLELTGLLSI